MVKRICKVIIWKCSKMMHNQNLTSTQKQKVKLCNLDRLKVTKIQNNATQAHGFVTVQTFVGNLPDPTHKATTKKTVKATEPPQMQKKLKNKHTNPAEIPAQNNWPPS